MIQRTIYLVAFTLLFAACKEEEKVTSWTYSETISLKAINPIGLTSTEQGIWLSDGDRNRLVLVDGDGKVVQALDSLDRPMHIASKDNSIYVPTYGNDKILKIDGDRVQEIVIPDSLDAPAGVDIRGNEMAIADFYNHRVLYSADGKDFLSIGKQGKKDGEFYYPTDVQITDDAIWVADAYNNRVQIFDKSGKLVKVIGAEARMNAATGIYVTEKELMVTDFESERVLIFDHDGNMKQELRQGVTKPTDVLIYEGDLYIANYRNGSMVIYKRN